ncbi:MAG TPA: hypothetical protein VEL07_01705 [Planctomycetota bacterium]|nr:hypothetical protein [Planctomycetota bacterium]
MTDESRREVRRSIAIRILWYVAMLALPALALGWAQHRPERWIVFGWLVGAMLAFSSPLSRGGAWVAFGALTLLAVGLRWLLFPSG